MQDSDCCDNNRTPVIIQGSDIFVFVGGISRIGTPKIRELTIIYLEVALINLDDDISIRFIGGIGFIS